MTYKSVAIVGCGRMGRTRARACLALGVPIRVACDPEQEAADAMAAESPGCVAVSQLDEIAWDSVDAVFVCTPPAHHLAPALRALERGIAIFVEKPLGLSAERVRPLVDLARRTGVKTAVGYHNRYRPHVTSLRHQLAENTAYALACHWVVGPYARVWWRNAEESGGPLNEQATHLVDLCRYLLGDVLEVYAVAGAGETDPDVADTFGVTLRCATGACATLLYSFRSGEKCVALEAFWPGGHQRLEGWSFEEPGAPPDNPDDVFASETQAFLGIRGDVLCDFEDAWQTQEVLDAIRRSVRAGAPERVWMEQERWSPEDDQDAPLHVGFTTVNLEDTRAHGGRRPIRTHRARRERRGRGINFVDLTIVPPGADIGLHSHSQGDEEIYVVVEGHGELSIEGTTVEVGPGDVVINPPGGTHALVNRAGTALKLVVIDTKAWA